MAKYAATVSSAADGAVTASLRPPAAARRLRSSIESSAVEPRRPLHLRHVAGALEESPAATRGSGGGSRAPPSTGTIRSFEPPDDQRRDLDLWQAVAGVVAGDRRQRVERSRAPAVPLGTICSASSSGRAWRSEERRLPKAAWGRPRAARPGAAGVAASRMRRADDRGGAGPRSRSAAAREADARRARPGPGGSNGSGCSIDGLGGDEAAHRVADQRATRRCRASRRSRGPGDRRRACRSPRRASGWRRSRAGRGRSPGGRGRSGGGSRASSASSRRCRGRRRSARPRRSRRS